MRNIISADQLPLEPPKMAPNPSSCPTWAYQVIRSPSSNSLGRVSSSALIMASVSARPVPMAAFMSMLMKPLSFWGMNSVLIRGVSARQTTSRPRVERMTIFLFRTRPTASLW